jgi:hypothetical protein
MCYCKVLTPPRALSKPITMVRSVIKRIKQCLTITGDEQQPRQRNHACLHPHCQSALVSGAGTEQEKSHRP